MDDFILRVKEYIVDICKSFSVSFNSYLSVFGDWEFLCLCVDRMRQQN